MDIDASKPITYRNTLEAIAPWGKATIAQQMAAQFSIHAINNWRAMDSLIEILDGPISSTADH